MYHLRWMFMVVPIYDRRLFVWIFWMSSFDFIGRLSDIYSTIRQSFILCRITCKLFLVSQFPQHHAGVIHFMNPFELVRCFQILVNSYCDRASSAVKCSISSLACMQVFIQTSFGKQNGTSAFLALILSIWDVGCRIC